MTVVGRKLSKVRVEWLIIYAVTLRAGRALPWGHSVRGVSRKEAREAKIKGK